MGDAAGRLSMATGAFLLIDNAPHPQPAYLSIGWHPKKALRSQAIPTTRTDVDESFLRSRSIPHPDVKYFDSADREYVTTTKWKVRERMKEILRK